MTCYCAKRISSPDKKNELARVLYAAHTISRNTFIVAIFSELNNTEKVSFNTVVTGIRPGLNFFCLCAIKGHPLITLKLSTDLNLKLDKIPTTSKHKETFRLRYYKHGKDCKEKNQISKLTSLAYQCAYANGLTDENFRNQISRGELPETLWQYRLMRYNHLQNFTLDQLFNIRCWYDNRIVYTCKNRKKHLGTNYFYSF